jgi:hypothetical protein
MDFSSFGTTINSSKIVDAITHHGIPVFHTSNNLSGSILWESRSRNGIIVYIRRWRLNIWKHTGVHVNISNWQPINSQKAHWNWKILDCSIWVGWRLSKIRDIYIQMWNSGLTWWREYKTTSRCWPMPWKTRSRGLLGSIISSITPFTTVPMRHFMLLFSDIMIFQLPHTTTSTHSCSPVIPFRLLRRSWGCPSAQPLAY